MRGRIRRSRPKPWAEYRLLLHRPWAVVLGRVEWWLSWVAWALANWAFLDVLEHLGTFSVLVGVVLYFSESGNRVKQKHYQAWQVINTAQGKGGNGGRIEALQQLNSDHISLVGVDASGAFLQGLSLPHGNLNRCNLHASDLRDSNLADASLSFCNLQDANLRSANLTGATMDNVEMQGADLHGATLRQAVLSNADLSGVDLRETDLRDLQWKGVASVRLANLAGVRNAPPDFIHFALDHGAVSLDSEEQWQVLLQDANHGADK